MTKKREAAVDRFFIGISAWLFCFVWLFCYVGLFWPIERAVYGRADKYCRADKKAQGLYIDSTKKWLN